ncbi:MAG: hypothetical protein FJ264_02855 [Planctomycetes bacterium]|nr:hypothetical protein [Planctomycetota bacterium]
MQNTNDKKDCGPCTACCDGWVKMNINGTLVYPGHPCPNITPKGCAIYASRPKLCADFNCSWLQNEINFPGWMRPDISRVIVKNLNWIKGKSILTAIPVGRTVPESALNYLKKISQNYSLPLLYFERIEDNGVYKTEMDVFGYGPKKVKNMLEKIRSTLEKCDQME